MNRVLILAHQYYPDGFIASHRAAQLAKYLPLHGWQPLVVCSEWTKANCSTYDPELLTDVVRATILRTLPFSSIRSPNGTSLVSLLSQTIAHPRIALQALLQRCIAKHILRFQAQYYCRALAFCRRYLRSDRVDCVFATCPLPAALAVADRLQCEFRVPWIADFRDTYDIRMQVHNEKRRRALLRAEPQVVASSSAVVTVSEALREHLERRHDREVLVLPNGFDPEDYDATLPTAPDRFTILYTGSLYYPDRDPRLLFSALTRLLSNGLVYPKEISVDFYCRQKRDLERILADYPALSQVVRIPELVSHRTAVGLQKGAHVLLHLAHGAERGIMTGKLFEYLAARRPILCIPGDRDCVDEVLLRTGSGVSCGTVDAVQEQLLAWYREWKATGTIRHQAVDREINKYSRREQAGALATILQRCVAETSPRHPDWCQS